MRVPLCDSRTYHLFKLHTSECWSVSSTRLANVLSSQGLGRSETWSAAFSQRKDSQQRFCTCFSQPLPFTCRRKDWSRGMLLGELRDFDGRIIFGNLQLSVDQTPPRSALISCQFLGFHCSEAPQRVLENNKHRGLQHLPSRCSSAPIPKSAKAPPARRRLSNVLLVGEPLVVMNTR